MSVAGKRRKAVALQTIVALGAVLTLYACGGGNSQIASGGVGGTGSGGGSGQGGGGGVGGTGIVALGTIAKAQPLQIVVNNTAFVTTPSTEVRIDDDTASLSALRSGMLVLVEGYKDLATQETEAEKITYRSNVRGPVDSVSTDCKSARVLGQPVQVNANTQPPLTQGTCDFTVGELLDVSGLVSDAASNTIVASYIRRMATPSTYQVSGAIGAAPGEHEFVIGGLTVDIEHVRPPVSASLLTAGSVVLVKGVPGEDEKLVATELELVQAGIGGATGHEAHLEGYVTDVVGKTFKISGQSVDASSAVLDPPTLVLADGQRVEIEGGFNAQGGITATHIELEDKDMQED